MQNRKLKRCLTLTILFSIVLLTIMPYAALPGNNNVLDAVSNNLIENGGFESGDLSNWDTDTIDNMEVTDEAVHTGKFALKIVQDAAELNEIRQTVEVIPHTDYQFTFYGTGSGGTVYKVIGMDETEVAEGHTNDTEEWIEYTVTFNSGDQDKVVIYISHTAETAYYDDFYLGEILASEQSLQPELNEVRIEGEAEVSNELTPDYDYIHQEGVTEGEHVYRWLYSDKEDGEYTIIEKGSQNTLTVTEDLVGGYIKLEITPIDSNGTLGEPLSSEAVGPVVKLEELDEQTDPASTKSETKVSDEVDSSQDTKKATVETGEKELITEEEDQLIQTESNGEVSKAAAESSPGNFITTNGTKLMDGDQEFKFISYNYPGALFNEDEGGGVIPTAFEQEDAIRSIKQSGGNVLRTYTLTVRDKDDPADAIRHIDGPGQINEEAFRSMDKLLQLANKYEVKVIIPFIDNWDWPPGGITDFAHFRGKDRMEFYTDPQLIEDFKQVMEQVLNRVNSYTGVKYKDDPIILGWETGNELMTEPEWMSEIAAYYKEINPNQLLISGNQMELPHYYKNITEEALTDPNIDVVKSHYYEGNFASKVREDKALADKYDKPFFVGEFGFKPTSDLKAMLDAVIDTDTSGALLWSLRPHSYNGGFIQHSEYEVEGILYRSYHWPGMPSGDYMDAANVMQLIRDKAYAIQGKDAPVLPKPANAPEIIETDSISELRWRGATGAGSYTIERAEQAHGPWEIIAEGVLDDVHPGETMFADTTAVSGKDYFYRVKGVNSSGESDYSNTAGPITAKHQLKDDLSDSSKQYYHDNRSVVYRTPGAILSFSVDTNITEEAGSEFAFYLSNDGIHFTEADVEKTGGTYTLDHVDMAEADQLKIVYPDGDRTAWEITNVTIEYYGDGSELTPISPLLEDGVLVDEMDHYSKMFIYSDHLVFDTENQDLFGGDDSRLIRDSEEEAFVIYRSLGDMHSFNLETFSEGKPEDHFTIEVSSDGETYAEIEADIRHLGGGKYKTNYYLEELPEEIKFLKVVYPEEQIKKFPQISRIQIAVGNGEIKFPTEAKPEIIEDGERYGGESLLLVQAYEFSESMTNLQLNKMHKSSGDYSLEWNFDLEGHDHVSIVKELPAADLEMYDTLQFWVKPDGYERELSLSLRTTDQQEWVNHVTVSGDQPVFVNIPVQDFESDSQTSNSSIINRNQIEAFSLSVAKGKAPDNGVLYLDDIRFIQTKIIDDFDSYIGENRAAFENRYSTSNEGGGEITASLSEEFVESGTHAMRLDYDLAGPGYAGIITELPHVNWSAYDAVRLWVKSAQEPVQLTIQVKTGSNEIMEATVGLDGDEADEWIEIPFSSFDYPSWYGGSGDLDPSEIIEFNYYLGLEEEPAGAIYIDSVELINTKEDGDNEEPGEGSEDDDNAGEGSEEDGNGDEGSEDDDSAGKGSGEDGNGDEGSEDDDSAGEGSGEDGNGDGGSEDDDNAGKGSGEDGNGDEGSEGDENAGGNSEHDKNHGKQSKDESKGQSGEEANEASNHTEKLPNTATNTFQFILIGLMLLTVGVVFYLFRKKYS